MLIRKFENFLEGRIEGFFNKKFASSLQIDEIENRLEKEFVLKKRAQKNRLYVPDSYTFIFGESDYSNLNVPENYRRLYCYIMRAAIGGDFFLEKQLSLQMAVNTIKDPGSFSIQSLYGLDLAADQKKTLEETCVPDHTLVFQKERILEEGIDYSVLPFAKLLVVEGEDRNAALEIGMKRIHIGRRENNEFFLQDKNCSRLHAYIAFEEGRHILCDAESLNGTFVNGCFVRRHALCAGDRIGVGNTVIVYEVE